MKTLLISGFALATASLYPLAAAQLVQNDDTPPAPEVVYPTVQYRVIWNSTLSDECQACDRLPVSYPLRGSAELQYSSFIGGTTWTFSNIEMESVNAGPPHYRITGSGTWSDSGQFCFPLCYSNLHLSLELDDGVTNRSCGFYRRYVGSIPQQSILQCGAPQLNGTPLQTFSIALTLAPVQDLWFSTRRGLSPASTNAQSGRVNNGDVLADSGRVVKRNADLLQAFGVPPDPALGGYDIDALSVAAGGEIVFSLREDVVTPTAGLLRHGDLLSDRGRIVKTNKELLRAFDVTSPAQDAGLDGVEVRGENFALFSITTNVFSQKLGVMLTSGDLLSDDGQVRYANQQLVGAFQPNPKDQNYGLAAFHAWYTPMAVLTEVWFCTEVGFESSLGPIAAGDLISSAGYIVYRNLELVAKFQPIEDLADFGLDGLFLVQEPQAWNATAHLTAAASPPGLMLWWETTGRVAQVERASGVSGPFRAVTPILPGLEWLDTGMSGANTPAFYRLRVW